MRLLSEGDRTTSSDKRQGSMFFETKRTSERDYLTALCALFTARLTDVRSSGGDQTTVLGGRSKCRSVLGMMTAAGVGGVYYSLFINETVGADGRTNDKERDSERERENT